MKIFKTRSQLEKWRRNLNKSLSVGFVPTMGALHQGHLSLVEKAQKQNDIVVVSIFVNPTQFGPKEDLKKYPRPYRNDLKLLKSLKVDVLFYPQDEKQVYPEGSDVVVKPRAYLNQILEARFRPGHFEGVATVVTKLFGMIQPHTAYFGEKDFQQLKVIQALVEDLFLPVKVVGVKTKREASGLAMSSRNRYLDAESQQAAARLYQTIKTSTSLAEAKQKLKKSGFDLQYLECWSPDLKRKHKQYGRWLVAAHFKGVRLIDNILRKKP